MKQSNAFWPEVRKRKVYKYEYQRIQSEFLGDSITEGIGVTDIANCRYDNRLAVMCQLSAVNNYGISGTRLAHQTHASPNPRKDLCFCGRDFTDGKAV